MADTDVSADRPAAPNRFWSYARILAAPLLLWGLVLGALGEPLQTWLRGEDGYDQAALKEWLDEARGYRGTLREMVDDYLNCAAEYTRLQQQSLPPDAEQAGLLRERQVEASLQAALKHGEIYEQLQTFGVPPTKRYSGQLPLFPIIYRLQVRFLLQDSPLEELASVRLGANGFHLDAPITWDSGLPSDASQYQVLEYQLHPYAIIYVRYQLHAYNKRQRIEQGHNRRLRQLSALAVAGTVLSLTWMVIVQRRERERERQRLRTREKEDQTERLLLQAERRHAETERQLLEQRLATQAAERQALELKSQMWASIGIMAGSYAHNIKNLLVRPNDLLRRCLDAAGLSQDQAMMIDEVQQTLGTVTERLQQILHTVRRDPSHAEATVLDVNAVVGELEQTWKELAREKWKLEIVLELNARPLNSPLPCTHGRGVGGEGQQTGEKGNPSPQPLSPEYRGEGLPGQPAEEDEALWIAGDVSHLQQAIENLLFNARDATFEMRNHLRDDARQAANLDAQARRQALIAAAAWRGRVVLRTFRHAREVILEVCDNGAGMADDVRRRCTETHFSTKRDNAIYEGHSTGMGLGLSFVVAILEHHRARLEIDSTPLCGTTFRVRFPATTAATTAPQQAKTASEESST